MIRSRLWPIVLCLFFLCGMGAAAQTGKKKPIKKTETQKTTKKTPVKKPTPQKSTSTKTTSTKKEQEKVAAPSQEKTFVSNATEDEQKVRDIVAFLQFMLNTLRSSATSSR